MSNQKEEEWKKLFSEIDRKDYRAKSYKWIHEGEGYESLEFTEEEKQRALNNLNKGVKFVSVVKAAAIDLSDDLSDPVDEEMMIK